MMKKDTIRPFCESARSFPIEKALAKLGYFPTKESEKEAWFLSPFRSETQASFKVSKTKNRWYDHCESVGGNVIDLVSRILKCSIADTLTFLNENALSFSFHQQIRLDTEDSGITIVKVQELVHPALIQYLASRKIPISIANQFCKEVWYSYKAYQFFAIGLRNNLNGWELRNKRFKNGSSPKSYTYIQNHSLKLVVVEGMFDLLSLATLDKTLLKTSDVIVLNSVSFVKRIEKYIPKYALIHLYLDNDTAGEKAAQYLIQKHKHVLNQSTTYKNYKDLNDLLCHENRKEI